MVGGDLKLRRTLGLHHGVAVICGLVIGSGIYVSPSGVLNYAGSPGCALIIWAATGLMSTLGALSFAELGTTYSSAGEKYVYLEKMYGPFMGFIYMWMYFFMFRPGANAIKCLVFGQYLLQPFYSDCSPPDNAVILMAILLACMLTFINCVNVKASARGQTLFTFVSICALLVIAGTGIVWLATGKGSISGNAFEGTSTSPEDIVLAIYSGIFAFGGWTALNFLTDELQNPKRNLPLAIMISMFLVTVLYVLVNLSYMVVLAKDQIISSQAVAVTFGQIALGPAAFVMSVAIVISTAGSLNSGTLVGSRLCFVAARNGHLPDIFALINIRTSAPIVSLFLQLILVIIMISVGDIKSLMNNTVSAYTLADTLTMGGMLYCRWSQPHLHRPLKMPIIIPVLFFLCMLFLFVLPVVTRPRTVGVGILLVFMTAAPAYLIGVTWTNKPNSIHKYYNQTKLRIQKLLYCAPEDRLSQD